MNQKRLGAAPLLWVFAVLAILFLLVERVIHSLEVEETIAESNRLERLAEVGFRNVTEWAKWYLERDVRIEKEEANTPNFDSLQDIWAVGPEQPYWDPELPELLVRWRIVDGHSRLNLNSLVNESGLVSESGRERLTSLMTELRLPHIDALVHSLSDWLDNPPSENLENETPGDPNAFEENARNAPLTLLGELAMVPGFTNDVLWREEDENIPGFVSCVTIHSDGKINPNTAPAWVIRASATAMTPSLARSLADGRPYETIDDVKSVIGDNTEINADLLFALTSSHFILEMESDYRGRTLKERVFLVRDYERGVVTVKSIERKGFFRWDQDLRDTMKESEEELLESIREKSS